MDNVNVVDEPVSAEAKNEVSAFPDGTIFKNKSGRRIILCAETQDSPCGYYHCDENGSRIGSIPMEEAEVMELAEELESETTKTNKQQPTKTNQMKQSESAADRYLAFMEMVQKRQRGFANIGKLLQKEGIGAALGTFLKRDGLIDKSTGTYKWSGPDPTIGMAEDLVNKVNDSVKKYAGKEKKKEAAPKVKHAYVKRKHQATSSSDILDLSKLRRERIELLSRIDKIDQVLEVAAGM